MEKFLVCFLLFIILESKTVLASESYSKVETQVEGEGQVYQYSETTVNGQTVKKESFKPGKLELIMEQADNNNASVSFSEEPAVSFPTVQSATPSTILETKNEFQVENESQSVFVQVISFIEKFFNKFSNLFKS